MNILINDRECQAQTGDRLLDVARANHSHIGYFCGGNAICQTCYVKVLEGAKLLSPMSDAEKAMLSDTLIKEGTRMACQATIEKPGTISLLTTVEEATRITLSNPGLVPDYMGKMGWESAVKFTDTIAFQAQRETTGHPIEPTELLFDVVKGIGDAIQLVIDAVQSAFGLKRPEAKPEPAKAEVEEHCDVTAVDGTVACRNGHGKLETPEALKVHEHSCAACN
ncbi:MAG TPA: (2Fe-2S)-binding protein [Chlorobaculum parvum]|uniref:(2Fe-2S)-binding protein n=1 Tax=Chlorobaculum parvum TaxID=274539 RepID=A0A7C5HSY1_9CHLB|nr:(2Fe-2S)-binding protein [Chlorobaculum parvum]